MSIIGFLFFYFAPPWYRKRIRYLSKRYLHKTLTPVEEAEFYRRIRHPRNERLFEYMLDDELAKIPYAGDPTRGKKCIIY